MVVFKCARVVCSVPCGAVWCAVCLCVCNVFVWTACDVLRVLLSGLCFVLLPWSCCLCVLRLLCLEVFVCGMYCVLLYGLFMIVCVCVRRSWCLCVVSVDDCLMLSGLLLFFRVCFCVCVFMSLCALFVNV